jgi:Cdc6-like AAA superfamily ATPase
MGDLILVKKERNYERYALKRNPFPYAGIPEENPVFCADRERELENVGDIISLCLSGHSMHVVLVGGYGNGKTHLLRFIKSQVNSQFKDSVTGGKAIAGYVISPGRTLIDTYRTFMQDLGRDFFVKLCWEFLGRVTLSILKKSALEVKGIKLDELKKDLTDSPGQISSYVEDGKVLLPEILKAARYELLRFTKSVDIVNGFVQLVYDDTALLAWKWLSGEQLLYEQRRNLGVVSPVSTDENALNMFQDVYSIMKELGYGLICLLIDEFEAIEVLQHQQKQRFLNSMRHLIDLNPSGLCLVISCTPEVWKNVVMEYHAFSERIFKEIILRPLSQDTVRRLIKEYLARSRTKGKAEKNGSSHPFTGDAIDEILKVSGGNIRRALALCNTAIDYGVKNESKQISSQIIKQLYESIM